jgi:von Willebrand factor type A domain
VGTARAQSRQLCRGITRVHTATVIAALATLGPLLQAGTPESSAVQPIFHTTGHLSPQPLSLHPQPLFSQPEPPAVKPVRIVVLVDESDSISKEDIEREREAASLIAQGEFAKGSVVSVVGFGSEDGPGQSPVDVVCPPTTVGTAQDRQSLSECVGALHRRTQDQGYSTDHAAALGQALSYLVDPSAGDEPKMIFLLTDGVLNVSDSPRYGPDNLDDRRNKAAQAAIDTYLDTARRNGVQIWPLGFGTRLDQAQLDHFADGGARSSCGPGSPSPRAVVVASSADVVRQLLTAFSAARCAGVGPIQSSQVRPGQTVKQTVTIPAIATDGSIIVFKRDPRIEVQYRDPKGSTVPKRGSANASTFEVSGENGPVEALRIVDPVPGDWTVQITSPDGGPELAVDSTVIYQGAVRASIGTDPVAPEAGQPMSVWLRVATRNRAIDPASLGGLSFSAELSGDGFTAVPVGAFADDGVGPDLVAGDGAFTGRVTIPASATGKLQVVGRVTGPGISGDSPVLNAHIDHGRSALRATVQLPSPTTAVAPGTSVTGSVDVTNESGKSRKVRLLITDLGPGTRMSISQAVHEIPPAGNNSFGFTLTIDSSTALGTNTATLQLVDDTDPDVVLYTRPITLVAGYPFPWFQVLGGIALLAAVIIVTIVLRARRRAVDVRGLVVKLYRGGEELGDLAAPDKPARSFWFLLQHDQKVPNLVHADRSNSEAYRISRPGGVPHVRTPFRGSITLLPLGNRLSVTHELSIEIVDEKELAQAMSSQNGGWSSDGEASRDPDDRGLL